MTWITNIVEAGNFTTITTVIGDLKSHAMAAQLATTADRVSLNRYNNHSESDNCKKLSKMIAASTGQESSKAVLKNLDEKRGLYCAPGSGSCSSCPDLQWKVFAVRSFEQLYQLHTRTESLTES